MKDKKSCFRRVICCTPFFVCAFFAPLKCFRHVQRCACVIARLICQNLPFR